MRNERILYLIESVEEAFNRYKCDYGFEEGVEYSDNGLPVEYELELLKQDTKDIIEQLELDCKVWLDSKKYQLVKDSMSILERLNRLYKELN